MEVHSELKEFVAEILRKEPPLIEGTMHVWATSKKQAKKLVNKMFPNYTIVSVKKS